MNMLPPARPGVSSCSIRWRTRAARPGLSDRISTLFERASATTITRCCASAVPPAAGSARSFVIVGTMSIADAWRTGTTIGSPPGGWSSEAITFSSRFRLSA